MRNPPQTNNSAGAFQAVSVSMLFLYSHREVEKEQFEKLLVDAMAELPRHLCKAVEV